MTKAENRTFLSHLWAELWCTKPSQQKKNEETKIVKDFFRLCLAVIAIENDDEGRKQIFSISPMGGVMVCQTLPAEKMKKKKKKNVKDFFRFSLAVIWLFCFRRSSSFSIAMTARLKRKKSLTFFFFFIFSAGRVWYTIAPPIGEIEKFCFRPSSSFSIAMTARLKPKN